MISRRQIISKSEDSSSNSSSSSASSSSDNLYKHPDVLDTFNNNNHHLYHHNHSHIHNNNQKKQQNYNNHPHHHHHHHNQKIHNQHHHQHHVNNNNNDANIEEDSYNDNDDDEVDVLNHHNHHHCHYHLQHNDNYDNDDEDDEYDENVWHNFQQLINDQLQEIRNKWNQIDDEIWAKIICFERNRRIAKAYARSQVISINGSDRGFDGYRIGLNGFPNPKRDFEVQMIKQQIRSGFKLKIDELGNVHIKRVGRCPVFVDNSMSNENLDYHQIQQNKQQKKLFMDPLEINKPKMIFDFKKFQHSMILMQQQQQQQHQHQQQQTPSKPLRQRMNNLYDMSPTSSSLLEKQCVHHIQLMVYNEDHHQYLKHPCWIVLINIVALDLFWSKFKRNDPIISRKLFSSDLINNHHSCVPMKTKNPLYNSCEYDYCENNENDKNIHCIDHQCYIRREKISDDLYYCGYAAKISNSSMSIPKQSSSTSTSSTTITTTKAKFTSSIPVLANNLNTNNNSNNNLKKKNFTPLQMTKPTKTKSRYIPLRPNPLKQLPTFNRIGLEQSKRLFFSSHQLLNNQNINNESHIKQLDDNISPLQEYSVTTNHTNAKYLLSSESTSSTSSSSSSSSSSSYNPHHKRFNHNQNRHNHNYNRYCMPSSSSKLNYRLKQTYRSTSDLLCN